MDILTIPVTAFAVNCYVVKDGGEAIVIDPGDASDQVLRAIDGCTVTAIVNTHAHCDHCAGNAALVEKTGAELVLHEADVPLLDALEAQGQMFGMACTPSPAPDRFVADGDTITVGAVTLNVVHAPGHSPGHIMLTCDGVVFCGDVLFAGSIGRTDLPGGNCEQLMGSIRDKLLPLADDTVVYTGHGPATTIGKERSSNPFVVGL